MKRVLLAAAITALMAGGLAAAPAAAAHAAATVVNPDFNESGGTTAPPGWSTYSPDGTASASYTEATTNGYGGDPYQLTHWSPAAYDVDTYQTLYRAPGRFLHARRVDAVQRRGRLRPDRADRLRRREHADRGPGRLRRRVGADRDVRPRDHRPLHDQPGH